MNGQQAIARSFGAAATHYDEHARLQRDVADTLLDYLPQDLAPEWMLDLGCGTGYCGERLQRRFPASCLMSLDLALPMLKRTRLRGLDTSLVCADAKQLPLSAGCFDLLFSSLTIQWCADLPALFAEVARVLRPGGLALLSTFGPATLRELRSAWAQVDDQRHVNDFAPSGALLAAARQSGLVCALHSETRLEFHASLLALGRSLKAIGAQQLSGDHCGGLTTPRRYRLAAERFLAQAQDERGVPVTWELYYLVVQKGAA